MPETMNPAVEAAIRRVIKNKMDRVMHEVLENDPFVPEWHQSSNPLYSALVPNEVFTGSHFERHLDAIFSKTWEELAAIIATDRMHRIKRSEEIKGIVLTGRLRRISRVTYTRVYDSAKITRPRLREEIEYIMAGRGLRFPMRVTCNLFVEDARNGSKTAFLINTSIPNRYQLRVTMCDILKLYAMNPPQIDRAYFVLPYNPCGNESVCKVSSQLSWFGLHNDECLLIGNEFWNLLGGDGTYDHLMKIVLDLGRHYRKDIYDRYLGITPPEHT